MFFWNFKETFEQKKRSSSLYRFIEHVRKYPIGYPFYTRSAATDRTNIKNISTTKLPGNGPAPHKENKPNSLFVIGIGSSAGGLKALEYFFSTMPIFTNVTIVVIQHFSHSVKSFLVYILQKNTKLKVIQIENGLQIEPGCIYVKPPDKYLKISENTLILEDTSYLPGKSRPIDTFSSL